MVFTGVAQDGWETFCSIKQFTSLWVWKDGWIDRQMEKWIKHSIDSIGK
jgi:hypothetical protein